MPKRKNSTSQAPAAELLAGRLMLRVSEYARLTGTPEPTVYKYIATGELASVRIGKTIRIPVAALRDQLEKAR